MDIMKKIFILILACCPLVCAAQSEWEAPSSTKAQESTKKVTISTDTPNDAKTQVKDWDYIKIGAVPEVEGKVVFEQDIDMQGHTAAQIYDMAYVALDSLAHTGEQIQSGIALINRKEHIIVGRYQEWLTFSKSFLSLDRTKFNYTVIAKCDDNKLHLSLERITYSYEENRSTGFKTTAEKWIADKYAVNKKRTKLNAGPAKFRKNTIERKKKIFEYISDKMKQQELQ